VSTPAPGSPDRRCLVLIVEDNPETAELIALVARDEGWYPVVASNGAQALARVTQAAPSIVLLDLMLPHEDGIAVGRRLADALRPPAPILAMSADRRNLRDFAGQVGAFASLEKPFDLDELVALIRKGLDPAAST
jgi:two-component system, OmpR family, response regulator